MMGWVSIHRKLAHNPFWLSDKFTRGQAWLDLILLANYKEGFIIRRGIKVKLLRGSIGWSEDALAMRWNWSRGKVRRFLQQLIEEKMIQKTTPTDNSVNTCIRIINYELYQINNTANDTEDDTEDDTENDTENERKTNGRQYTNNKDNKDNKENNTNKGIPTSKDETINYDEIQEYFNVTCVKLPKCKYMTAARKRMIKALVNDFGNDKVIKVINKTVASDFLNGKTDKPFVASFDWIFKPTNFLKIYEGNYDNKKKTEHSRPVQTPLNEAK